MHMERWSKDKGRGCRRAGAGAGHKIGAQEACHRLATHALVTKRVNKPMPMYSSRIATVPW